jgi:hypothetical protein
MKNIYKITKLQLIILWLFGVVYSLIRINNANNQCHFGKIRIGECQIPYSLIVFIVFILIFYTIGWFNYKKKQKKNIDDKKDDNKVEVTLQ